MLKRLFLIPLIITVLYACGSSAALRVGEPAPGFEGLDTSGKLQRLADYRGKTVVLEWTNHDCPYVRKHYGAGNMQEQQRQAAAQGVVWLSVISSAPGKQGHVSPEEADELTRTRNAAPLAVILDSDGRIGRAYMPKRHPICLSSMKPACWLTWAAWTASARPTRMTSRRPRNTCALPCRSWQQASPSAHRLPNPMAVR